MRKIQALLCVLLLTYATGALAVDPSRHASTHYKNAVDPVNISSLPWPSCTTNNILKCDGAGGLTASTDNGDSTIHTVTTQAEASLSNEVVLGTHVLVRQANCTLANGYPEICQDSDDNKIYYCDGTTCYASTAGAGSATDVACTDCVALSTETTGNYVQSITAGAGIGSAGCSAAEGATCSLVTASDEADFLKSGALTCGAGTQGKAQVSGTTPLQYCDNNTPPALKYSAYGDANGNANVALNLSLSGQATGALACYNGSSWVKVDNAASSGKVLTSVSGACPTWQTAAAGGGTGAQMIFAAAMAEADKISLRGSASDTMYLAFGSIAQADDQDTNAGETVQIDTATSAGVPFPAGTLGPCGMEVKGISAGTATLNIYVNGASALNCSGNNCYISGTTAVTAGQGVAAAINKSAEPGATADAVTAYCFFTKS